MLIVTGGAGFIGSNLVHELNAHGLTDILVVDNLANAKKFENLHGARYTDYMDKREFRRAIAEHALGTGAVEAVSNAESGFFRPVPLDDGRLLVLTYTGAGFVPATIEPVPIADVSAIKFLGSEVVAKYPTSEAATKARQRLSAR